MNRAARIALAFLAGLAVAAFPGSDILDASLDCGAKCIAGSVTSAVIADGTVTTTDIADGTIAAADLAANAVTVNAILDGSVTAAKIVNINRTVSVPITAAANCSTTAAVAYNVNGNPAPDFNVDGATPVGIVLRYQTGDTNYGCVNLQVPQDYVSGVDTVFRAHQSGANGGNIETVGVRAMRNNGALGAEVTGNLANQVASQSVTVAAPGLGGLAAGDSVMVLFRQANAAGDDIVFFESFEFRYVATE